MRPDPIFFTVMLSVILTQSFAVAQPRPNIVLIVVDDLGFGELGCYGGQEIPTPHIDALAQSGVRFTNGYVTAPFCAASRAALMTGRYQTRFGFEFNPIGAKNAAPGIGLPTPEKTIADDYMQKFLHIKDIHRRIFAAMLAHLDDSVGKVLTRLRELGIDDNTLVVFLSDNGGPTKELTSSNLPLSGGKGELREGGIRVPFIVSWKKRVPSGKVLEEPVVSIDIAATALEIGNAQAEAKPLDGQNLVPWLTGQAASLPDRALFWRVGTKHAIRSGDWKLIRSGQQWQLYNLARDIGEKNNLASHEPARVQQLSIAWEQWNAQQLDPLWK